MARYFDTEDLEAAFAVILKLRYGFSGDKEIEFDVFKEVLTYLYRLNRDRDPEEDMALSDLELCSAMKAEDWIANFQHLCEEHAQNMEEDVPSR